MFDKGLPKDDKLNHFLRTFGAANYVGPVGCVVVPSETGRRHLSQLASECHTHTWADSRDPSSNYTNTNEL
eukprot:707651-Amphidinium_carterae.1